MFTNANLSFEAAPPINVVLRFFLTGALFGVITAGMLFFHFETLTNIYAPNTLIIVHLLSLGVVSNFLFGALFQMLPVVAGVSIANAQIVAMRVHYTLLLGVIFLLSGFGTSSATLYLFGGIFLGFAFFYSAFVGLRELIKIKHSASSKGMLLSLSSLFLLVVFAFILLAFKSGYDVGFDYLDIKRLHFSFGLFGLFMLLLFSISFQVIEMFYVTPPYPKYYAKYVGVTLFALLVLSIFIPSFITIAFVAIALIALIHSTLTIKLLRAKKRAVSDVTIWLWYFAMANLMLFGLTLLEYIFFSVPITAIALFFSFFILATILAMVFKIVPFLVWFQLNRQGYFDGPMMHEVIHPKVAKRLFYLFFASYLLFLGALFFSSLSLVASVFLFISFLWLGILIYNAWQKYLHTLKNGMKIEFPLNM